MMPQDAIAMLHRRAWPRVVRDKDREAAMQQRQFPHIAPSPNEAVAQTIARRRPRTAGLRARRIFNVHAHANRRAPPGGDPGRRRQGKPDRGV